MVTSTGLAAEACDLVFESNFLRELRGLAHGYGEYNTSRIEHIMDAFYGVSAGKLFLGDFYLTITRGKQAELAHHCYLDNYAYHAVLSPNAHITAKLYRFCPFDYGQLIVIEETDNYGFVAYIDGTEFQHAISPPRHKSQLYTSFSASNINQCATLRNKKTSHMGKKVAREDFEDVDGELFEDTGKEPSQAANAKEILPAQFEKSSHTNLAAKRVVTDPISPPSAMYPVSDHNYPGQLFLLSQECFNWHVPYNRSSHATDTASHHTICSKNRPKLVSVESLDTTEYLDGKNQSDLGSGGSIATTLPRAYATSVPAYSHNKHFQAPMSPLSTSPGIVTYDGADDGGEDKVGGEGIRNTTGKRCFKEDNDSERENKRRTSQHSREAQLEAEIKIEKAVNQRLREELRAHLAMREQLLADNEALTLHNKANERENAHLKEATIQTLADRASKLRELTYRIAALQNITDTALASAEHFEKIAEIATKEIEPTTALRDGLASIMDAPAKYMYDKGFDELWNQLQNEAIKRIGTEDTMVEWKTKKWNYA